MTAEKYVGEITRKIKCSKNKREEIRQQLLSDIAAAQENGEPINDIIDRMGSANDVAREFNENMPAAEKRKYRNTRIIAPTVICIGLVIILLTAFLRWFLPRTSPIGASGIFTSEEVETKLKEAILEVNQEDYAALKDMSIPAMRFLFNQESMTETKNLLSDDWGDFLSFGDMYIAELKQQGQLFALGQIEARYENVTVIFTITFDTEMRLAGFYIK